MVSSCSLFAPADLSPGALAGSRIGVRTLPPHGQRSPMAKPTVRSQVHQTLNIHGNFPTQIAFNFQFGTINRLANFGYFPIRQLVGFPGEINLCRLKKAARC
jgi:hypothetical protein